VGHELQEREREREREREKASKIIFPKSLLDTRTNDTTDDKHKGF
jgi:hypothetical protein